MLIVKCRRQTRGSEDGIHTENCGIPAGIAEGVGTTHLQGVVDVSEGRIKAVEVSLWLRPDGFSVGREEGLMEPCVQRQEAGQNAVFSGPWWSWGEYKAVRNGYTI